VTNSNSVRHLVLVLGDQLNRDASAWDGFDATRDMAWMAEASEESTHVWSSKQRIVVFLSAMRHFAQALRDDGIPLRYTELAEGSLADALGTALKELRVDRVIVTQPGDWRVLQGLRAAVGSVPLEVREDRHFMCSTPEFAAHANGRKSLRMEYFYREMRRRHAVLMDDEKPAGGEWNFDVENRGAFGRMRPRRRSSIWSTPALPHTRAPLPRSAGPSHVRRRCKCWRHSSKSGCHTSASGKTRCGAASPGCTTRISRWR
jgi:deoxyribodipyrimidine photolyase-related protein